MKVHLIGVGGIGVSALAQYYLSKGHQVSGSDLIESETTNFLKKKGIKISTSNSAKNIKKDTNLVIYSPAVKKNNPEFKKAKSLKIKILSYPEALGELTKEYYTIAIAGAHGKSTTTAMIGLVLAEAGLDPTVIVGTKVKGFDLSSAEGNNFRLGQSKILVIEACEYDSSFLYYCPKITVITNVDKEHLDYFKTFANVIRAFKKFINKLPEDGYLVYNSDDKNIPIEKNSTHKKIGYSLESNEAVKIKRAIKIPGQHNVSNALATFKVAKILEIPDIISFRVFSDFTGTWRRFEEKNSRIKGLKIISDYGHHPNEILATLGAARQKYKKETIWCVFQPHQHQRTRYLFNDFIKVFRKVSADKIIITDIYDVAGRETKSKSGGINSKKLVSKIKKNSVIYCEKGKLEKFIKESRELPDVLMIMGAGDIYELVDKF